MDLERRSCRTGCNGSTSKRVPSGRQPTPGPRAVSIPPPANNSFRLPFNAPGSASTNSTSSGMTTPCLRAISTASSIVRLRRPTFRFHFTLVLDRRYGACRVSLSDGSSRSPNPDETSAAISRCSGPIPPALPRKSRRLDGVNPCHPSGNRFRIVAPLGFGKPDFLWVMASHRQGLRSHPAGHRGHPIRFADCEPLR